MENKSSLELEFEKSYEEFSDAIFRFCYFRLFDRDVAKDATQEVFCRVWEYLASGKTIENMRAFLYRVARNHLIDMRRRPSPVSLEELAEVGFDPASRDFDQLEVGAELNIALKRIQELSKNDQEVITMRFVDGLGPQEIAEAIGESANVVSVRLHRALSELQKIFEKKVSPKKNI